MSKLDAMNPRDPERREMLATLLYVLQDAPEALLREMWKDVSDVYLGVCFFCSGCLWATWKLLFALMFLLLPAQLAVPSCI